LESFFFVADESFVPFHQQVEIFLVQTELLQRFDHGLHTGLEDKQTRTKMKNTKKQQEYVSWSTDDKRGMRVIRFARCLLY
jgi:hypothetical protein